MLEALHSPSYIVPPASFFIESPSTQLIPKLRRLISDIADTAGGGSEHGGENKEADAIPAKSRIGRKTREAVRAVATADGGLELEVSDSYSCGPCRATATAVSRVF